MKMLFKKKVKRLEWEELKRIKEKYKDDPMKGISEVPPEQHCDYIDCVFKI